jgi:hypothetical protein
MRDRRSRLNFDQRLIGLTWGVVGDEKDGGGGSVLVGKVASEVLEVESEVYEVLQSLRKMCEWSEVSDMASCGGYGRTEGLQHRRLWPAIEAAWRR